jgi:hypothetical protein
MKVTKSSFGAIGLLVATAALLQLDRASEALFLPLIGVLVLASFLTGYWIRRERKVTGRLPIAALLALAFVWILLVLVSVLPLFG